MYRYLVLVCFLFCLLTACQERGPVKTQKIGVVNINRILVDSEPGRAAAKYMEGLQDSLRNEANELQKKLQKAAEAAEKEGDRKEDGDSELQKEVQMEYVKLQGKLQSEQQNVNNILNDVVHRVVDSFRKTNGYSIILFSDVAISFEDAVDVTSGVTNAMNAEKVEFKPLPEPKREAPDKAESEKK